MSSKIDFLARPIYPEASHHKPLVSPTYCLRQCPAGFWYLIPFIYEYGFEMFSKAWVKEHMKKNGMFDRVMKPPAYAQSVDLKCLTFEKPHELPCQLSNATVRTAPTTSGSA